MNHLSPSVAMESLMESLIVRAEQQASVQHLPWASAAEGLPQQHTGSGGTGGRVIPTWEIGGVAAVLPPKVAFACGQPILHTWSSQIGTAIIRLQGFWATC